MKQPKFYQLDDRGNGIVDIAIYSDVVDGFLDKDLEACKGASQINVRINSYGGEVAAGLQVYNALVNSPANVTTWCDGVAASIASVIFMAGDKRIMNEASCLMIHNAWAGIEGNANEMRQAADQLDKLTMASIAAYMSRANIEEGALRSLMDAETVLTAGECLEMGFATSVARVSADKPAQRARAIIARMLETATEEDQVTEDEKTAAEQPEAPKCTCPNCGYKGAPEDFGMAKPDGKTDDKEADTTDETVDTEPETAEDAPKADPKAEPDAEEPAPEDKPEPGTDDDEKDEDGISKAAWRAFCAMASGK